MRASVLRGGRMVCRDDLPEPVPGPGQVLVAVKACGICGSDLHFAEHGQMVLDRIELEVWWMSGRERKTFTLDSFRPRMLKAEDFVPAAGQ